jgi:hypothetical protein
MWIALSLRIGIAVIVALALGLSLGPERSQLHHIAERFPTLLATPHTFEFRTRADAALTDWALSRFQQAGLELPPLIVAFHDSKQPCDGNVGLYSSDDTPRVDICGFNWDRFLITPKKTILHELAHAWTHYNLTEDDLVRFLRFRGLDTWADGETPWQERGSEQAAEVIAWALMDREIDIGTIRGANPETLAQAYELLTSTRPPSRARTPLTLIGAVSTETESLLNWAVGRFREAGLDFPKVELVFDRSGNRCEGASGRFTDTGNETRAALCTGQEGPTLNERVAILHEPGHAWATRSVSEPVLAPGATPHTFNFRTPEDAALTEWALARFEAAGLELPELVIAFHDDRQGCNGHPGFYRSGTPARVDVCDLYPTPNHVALKRTLLHELGHAWADHTINEETKARFLADRGLSTWGDPQTPWEEKGAEHAAEIITWALMDQELHMVTMEDVDPATLAALYQVLTGTTPPAWGRTPLTVIGTASLEDEALAAWAAGRFQEAALTLPPVTITFDPTGQACQGVTGRFTDNQGEMAVALCTGQKGLTLTNRVAILHELGHAWLTRSVSTEVQTTFLHLRGLETWNDHDQAWHLRGAEHAADIIAWALMDREVWMYRIRPNDFDSLQNGYQLLTGKQPTERIRQQASLGFSMAQTPPTRNESSHRCAVVARSRRCQGECPAGWDSPHLCQCGPQPRAHSR